MNKTAIMKAAAHADKNSENANVRALTAAGEHIQKQDAQKKLDKAAMKAMGKSLIHTGERVVSLGAASFTNGAVGTELGGVDMRAVLGAGGTIIGGVMKVVKPKSKVTDHLLAVSEGIGLSYVADASNSMGKKAREKWDARGQGSSVSGAQPARDVTLTPPAISGDRLRDELPTGFAYVDAVEVR